jgi:hypothetical protein
LAQRIDAAEAAVLAEFRGRSGNEAAFGVLRRLTPKPRAGSLPPDADGGLTIRVDLPDRPGGLFLLLGEPFDEAASKAGPNGAERPAGSAALRWQALAIEETGYAYLARLPSARRPAKERLRHAARFLEHADPLVAADAYAEFAHAPYDEVRRVADALSSERLRQWLVDQGVPAERRGFYAVALGLAESPAERTQNAALLEQLIDEPADDFRAGFDGVLAGYLLLAGGAGLDKVETKLLANRKARDGDVRHALSALRFYHDYGRDIPPERLGRALVRLLARPEFAAAAIVDLARWEYWPALALVARLYGAANYDTPAVREAVVGYLLVCPEAAAKAALAELRARDPAGVAAAEAAARRLGGVK